MRMQLTNRECEVMEYLIQGFSPIGIAKKLYMERSSIYSFIRRIYFKYGLKVNKDYDIKIVAIRKYLKGKKNEL